MNSFEDLFCQAHRCSPADFQRKVFWRCLTWRGKLLAPFLGGATGRHFGSDRTFIAAVGRATDMVQVRVEVREYFEDPLNRGWLRQVADVRVSTRRVKNLARRFLPDSGSSSLPPWTSEEAAAPGSGEWRGVA